uniref:Uncharacterized protein n=1 Tax=viral metagenome TaxID=1070528 RepID=A0A6C0JVA3_9ZZZZ
MTVSDDWDRYCNGDYTMTSLPEKVLDADTPLSTDISVSTKTMISFLNQTICLQDMFWKIPIIPYHIQGEGVIKKQIKLTSVSQDEVNEIANKTNITDYVDNQLISRVIDTDSNTYKDVRKISIGISKRDITSYRCKKKGAFYNCFVLILRIIHDELFKEIHVKVFNTGKLEIPGIKTDGILEKTILLLCRVLQPLSSTPLSCDRSKHETVLINSNFRCGYFIEREKLYQRLKNHYRINCMYDPCSYPGIQGEIYLNNITNREEIDSIQYPKHEKMSFMIFRTGSVLIVGKGNTYMLNEIYTFLKQILINEYTNVGIQLNDSLGCDKAIKKTRKKIILIEP